MTLQCTRRFIESNFLQIFSKKSKINLTHYLCGYLHYYGVFVLIVAKADGFVKGEKSFPFLSASLTSSISRRIPARIPTRTRRSLRGALVLSGFHLFLVQAVRVEHDLHKPPEEQVRLGGDGDSSAAQRRTLHLRLIASHDLRGGDVRSALRAAPPEHFQRLLLGLGGHEPVLQRAADSPVVSRDILRLSEGAKGFHSIHNLSIFDEIIKFADPSIDNQI